MVEVRRLERAEVETSLDALAELRIEVFRAFPYLYEGDRDYERRYLATYLASLRAVIVGARDGARLVGAATASPLTEHFDAFAEPFAQRGLDADDIFYFGESVLQRSYRGRGIGVRFFEERENAAREYGFSACVFAAVVRPVDHPLRPADYRPLDGFWRNRGYERLEGMQTSFSWRDIGEDEESAKPMEYWMKRL